MANALRKMHARVKKLRKRYPKKKYASLMKQAGKEFKAGKLGARKRTAAKRKPAKRKAVRKRVVHRKKAVHHRKRRRVAKPKVIRRRTVVVYKSKKRRTRRRSVGGMGKVMKILPIIAAGVGLYLVLKPKTVIPPIIQTSNPVRNQTASDAVAYAQAAGIVGTALANIIKALNASDDTQVQKIYDNVKSGQDPMAGLPGGLAGIGSRVVMTRRTSMQ